MAYAAKGANIKFICNFLINNPGSTYTQIRNALCIERGIDPKAKRGQYCSYFAQYIGCLDFNYRTLHQSTVKFPYDQWEKRDGKYYITSQGIAYLSK